MRQASREQEAAYRGVEEGLGRGDGSLEILRQSPVAIDPGEEALYDPSSRRDDEAEGA